MPAESTAETHQVPSCVCALGLPCGEHLREQRRDDLRRGRLTADPPRRYRNTEGLRGHANARKRADS